MNKISLLIFLLFATCTGTPIYAQVCLHDCQVDDAGYSLIEHFEGYSPFIYKDSIGVPTVGFGHAVLPDEDIKTPLLGDDALRLLQNDVQTRTQHLNEIILVPVAPQQFDAVTSFAYNVGIRNLERSTLLKKINDGDNDSVHSQFLLWDRAGGKVLSGLRSRREAEADLYDEGAGQ